MLAGARLYPNRDEFIPQPVPNKGKRDFDIGGSMVNQTEVLNSPEMMFYYLPEP